MDEEEISDFDKLAAGIVTKEKVKGLGALCCLTQKKTQHTMRIFGYVSTSVNRQIAEKFAWEN